MTRAHRDNCMNPHTVKHSHTLMPTHRGLARGQRVRRVSMDESVESEPGRHWSSATHTASTSVPRSRAENKSRPTLSIWPAALPDSQPENSWFEEHIVAWQFIFARFKVQCGTCFVSAVLGEIDLDQWIPTVYILGKFLNKTTCHLRPIMT